MTQYPFTQAEMNFVPAGIRNPEARYIGATGAAERNYEPDRRSVKVADGRIRADDYGVDSSGFELIQSTTALGAVEDPDHPDIRSLYYPEVEETLRRATGASEVLLFDHTIRITGSDTVRRPVQHVHNDYTHNSAPIRLAQLLGADTAAEWLKGRVAQVNLWRPLKGPVRTLPLALVDARSIGPHDLRDTALIYDDRVGHIYHLSHNDAQRWVYFPEMTRDEAILIKGYDSAEDGRARFTPHTAFSLPGEPVDAPPRHSIEVRSFLRFD